jgi:hypothetical protein
MLRCDGNMKQMSLDFERCRVPAIEDPDEWLRALFSSQAAHNGKVVRRKLRDIERYAGWERFTAELARRGYRAVENDGQVVIFCNRAPVRPIRLPPPGG